MLEFLYKYYLCIYLGLNQYIVYPKLLMVSEVLKLLKFVVSARPLCVASASHIYYLLT